MVNLAFIPDMLKRTVQTMTEFDTSWKLPEGFFVEEPKTGSFVLPNPTDSTSES